MPADGISSGKVYFIMNVNSGKCFDVSAGNTANGSDVAQYTFTPSCEWQSWQITYCGDGDYKIKDMHSGKLLSVEGSSSAANANVWIWQEDGTVGQRFRIRRNDDGTVTFLTKASNYTKAIGIYNSGLNNGDTAVQQSNDDGSDNQKFVLINSTVRVYIFSSGGYSFSDFPNESGRTKYGHAWIKILNTSDISLNICDYPYPLQTGDQITIGRWGNASSSSATTEYEGIWFNMENKRMFVERDFTKNVCTYVNITISQLDTIISTTQGIYDGYGVTNNNCVDYAIHMWNLVSEDTINASDITNANISQPAKLEEKIIDYFDYYITNVPAVYTQYYGYYKNSNFVKKTY